MGEKVIYGALIIILTIAYTMFVATINFPVSYKILLFIPSLIFIMIFLLLAMSKRGEGEGESTFPY